RLSGAPAPGPGGSAGPAIPAKWDTPEWLAIRRPLAWAPIEKAQMHRKAYELTQTIFGLQRLGRLTPDASVLGVGAGHEPILYWLANHVGKVGAPDLYEGEWQSKVSRAGDPRALAGPPRV